MATTDPETVVSEGDHHHHHHHHHHQAVEKETTDSSNSKEDGNKGEDEISVKELEEAPTEDKLPVVDQPPNLEVPVNAASKQVEAPVPESEASSVVGAAGRAVEEQSQGKPETVAAEQVQERASDLEAAEIEANNKIAPQVTEIVPEEQPTLEPVHKEPEEKPAVDGGVAKENIEKLAVKAEEWELEERRDLESETKTKEEVVEGEVKERLDSELKEVPALEVDEYQPESSEIETIEKCEDEAINPTTNEAAADEPVQKVEDVPVEDSDLEIKKEPEETPKPLSQEVEQTSAIDQVVDAPKGKPQEIKDVAEEVEAKTTEEIAEDDEGGKDDKEDGTTSTAPKSVAAETFFPVVEAETDIKEAGVDKVVYKSENTETEEINTAARGNVAVEEIAKEDRTAEEGNQEKDVKADEQTDETVEKAEESVPTACNNGFGHDETEGKLKDDSVVENDVRVEQVLEEKNACLEGLPPTPSEAASVEDSGSLIARKEVPDKLFEGGQVSRDLEVVMKEAEELEEEMGTMEPEAGSKDSQSETKVEETMKDDTANEYEPSKATAEQAKHDPSTLEASNSKDVGDDTKASQDIRIPTAEVVKSAHKSSGNIMSKVKQSLVKVKKAITGKSPSSKTSSTESKADDKAK